MPSISSNSRRVRRAASALLLAAAVAVACARSGPQAEIAAEVEKGVNAVRTKNIDAYMEQIDNAALSPDSTAAARAREMIRTNVLADWSKTTTRSMHVTVDSISALGDSAIVATTLHWDRLVTGILVTDTVVSDIHHRELWRHTPKGWRPFKVLGTNGKSTTNGKEEIINRGG